MPTFLFERLIIIGENDMSIFKNKLSIGSSISPFMVAGVPSKRYEGERSYAAYERAADEMLYKAANDMKDKVFAEYDEFEILDSVANWEAFCDIPTYAAGTYTVFERYAIMPIYIVLESQKKQKVKLGIYADRCIVLHNGVRVFDNPDIYSKPKERVYVFEHKARVNVEEVELELDEGDNRILILTGRVNRSTGFMFTAFLKEAEHGIYAKIPISIDSDLREKMYASQAATHLTDDSYKDGEGAVLIIGGNPDKDFSVEVTHNDKTDILPIENGCVKLPEPRKIGRHTVNVVWRSSSGKIMAKSSFAYGISRIVEPMPGFENFDVRRKVALEDLAKKNNYLALYRLGRYSEVTSDLITPITEKVLRRDDCADFHLLPLLWLAWEDRGKHALSEDIREKIKEAALAFKYWVDEGGASSMIFCSENHRIGFHVCEYLAGLLYPADNFTNSNQNGVFHSLKGRMHLMEWLTQRSKFGFDEPHSDNYFPVSFTALLVLREILPLEEYPLRNMVNVLLDFMVYIAATSMLDGVMATPRARSYSPQLRSKYSSPMTPLCWMLFGNSDANPAGFLPELAFSYYVPPKALCDLAYDYTPTSFHFKEGLMHFDKFNADFTIRRTADYMMGGVRDHNEGMCDMHFTPMFAALKGNIPIFISAPQNNADGMGLRPDYWAGEAHLPRVLMHGRMLITIFNEVKNFRIWMTHCHFPRRRFDEIKKQNGWTFGRKENGYVAIWSSNPHELALTGKYAERELIAYGRECVWLTVCGSADEDGSFGDFIENITAMNISLDEFPCSVTTPERIKLEFGLNSGFKADGKDVEIPEYLSLSPWLKSKFGSGKYEYTIGDYVHTDWTYPATV